MSHMRNGPTFRLAFSEAGSAELLKDGATHWSSDADPEFVDEFGEDLLSDSVVLDDDDIADVLDWLVEQGYMTDDDADKTFVSVPQSWGDDDDQADDDDDDDDEEISSHEAAY